MRLAINNKLHPAQKQFEQYLLRTNRVIVKLLSQHLAGSSHPMKKVILESTGDITVLILSVHAQRGLRYLVCKCVRVHVRLSVTTFSATTCNETKK
jgi:hypothetical protein